MKNFLVSFLMFICSSAFALNCDLYFPEKDTCADLKWSEAPTYNKYLSIELTTFNPRSGEVVALDETLSPLVWMIMPGMEHGGKKLTIKSSETGKYLIEKIWFMGGMEGVWQFKVKLLSGTTVVSEAKIDVLKSE